MIRTWRLDGPRQTLALGSRNDRLPRVIYWGPRLPDDEDMDVIYDAHKIDVTGGMLDANPELTICPESSRTFPGQPGLVLADGDGSSLYSRFFYESEVKGENHISLTYSDEGLGLVYTAHFLIDPETHILESKAVLEANRPVRLHWLSAPVVPAPHYCDEMWDFTGRWCGEFQIAKTPWTAGGRYRNNRSGRTGHEAFPGLILPCRGATNTAGEAYAFHYGWSGGHRMVAEELPDGRRQVQFGHANGTEKEPGTRFETATLYATYSDEGINGCAVSFQRHLRDRIVKWPDPNRPRPVHYNCWEAVYFDHKIPVLQEIATKAAALGAERFVLDDGWFGLRDDDTRALADWQVDPRKYPDGLGPLIDHVHAEGMSFGIWLEPEMINPDSETYRAHPDWALGLDDQILGRQQMCLDMSNPSVRDYLYEQFADLLGKNDIDYIKWDHNRVLPMPDAAQPRGTYLLLDRLRRDFPKVEIESCASGGGRIDFGILQRTQRVWLSDSNDALERLKIQHNAALFLPMAITGSHVGPRECHTSGRVLDIRFRAWVAAQRHMGFEMDPRELSEQEVRVLQQVTTWWKTNRLWMTRADILRLDSADPAVIAEQQMAEDGTRFVVFAGKADTSTQVAPRPLRLTGLDPAARYRVDILNREDLVALSRGTIALKEGPIEASGRYLMTMGIALPWSFPDHMWVVEGERL